MRIPSRRACSVSAQPSRLGSMRSTTHTSGRSKRSFRRARSPSSTHSTSCPACRRCALIERAITPSSSTSSTRAMGAGCQVARWAGGRACSRLLRPRWGSMVRVAQSVEPPVVVREVAGSSPVSHPHTCSRQGCRSGWGLAALPERSRQSRLGCGPPMPWASARLAKARWCGSVNAVSTISSSSSRCRAIVGWRPGGHKVVSRSRSARWRRVT